MALSVRKPLVLVAVCLAASGTVALAPAAQADTPGGYLWAVDTADPITADFLSTIRSEANDTPDVWGRYINFCASACTTLTKSEITTAENDGISLYFLSADTVGKSTSSQGTSNASATVSAAKSLGIPKGALLVDDLENDVSTSSGYLENWYKGITGGGYLAGFYTGSQNFVSSFCAAVKADSAMKTAAIATPDTGSYGLGGAKAPSFSTTSDWPSCGGTHSIWQYTIPGSSGLRFDQDEIDPHTSGLLLPNGSVSGGGSTSGGGYVTSGGFFEHTDSAWHGIVKGTDNDAYELVKTPTTQWTTNPLGGQIAGQPSITHVGDNYDYWVLSPSGHPYRRTYSNGALSASWTNLGIATVFSTKYGLTASYFGGTYRLFGVGSNGHVYVSTDNNGTWSTIDTGGNEASTVGVVYVDGEYDLYAVSPSGHMDHYQNNHGTIWNWHASGITTDFVTSRGVSVIYAGGEYRVFGIGVDGNLYQNYYSNTDHQWHAQALGSMYGATLTATYNNGRYDVFNTTSTGNVDDKWYTSSTGWSENGIIAYVPTGS